MPMFGKNENALASMSDAETVIGSSVKIEGDFTSQGDVIVEGAVRGTLKTEKNLRVNPGAIIHADIRAENAYIAGEVHGNVKVKEKLDVTETAKIFGDVETKTLTIAVGGILQGKCIMMKEEKTKGILESQKKAATA